MPSKTINWTLDVLRSKPIIHNVLALSPAIRLVHGKCRKSANTRLHQKPPFSSIHDLFNGVDSKGWCGSLLGILKMHFKVCHSGLSGAKHHTYTHSRTHTHTSHVLTFYERRYGENATASRMTLHHSLPMCVWMWIEKCIKFMYWFALHSIKGILSCVSSLHISYFSLLCSIYLSVFAVFDACLSFWLQICCH